MSNISKELLRNYVNEQSFSTPDDVLNAMKEMFKDVLQEVLEAPPSTIHTLYHNLYLFWIFSF